MSVITDGPITITKTSTDKTLILEGAGLTLSVSPYTPLPTAGVPTPPDAVFDLILSEPV